MISGVWWLVGIVLFTAVLFVIALKRRPTQTARTGSSHVKSRHLKNGANKRASPHPLEAFYAHVVKQLSHSKYEVKLRQQHVLISDGERKVAMLTLDKKLHRGTRKLGEVLVVNFHRFPSQAQILAAIEAV